jgi:hypothetical protein
MATKSLIRYKLIFHVPTASLEVCKNAIFAAGAGRYPGPGNYTECCWTTIGTGQFRPGDTANPHIGSVGKLEKVEEARVEMICVGEDVARKAVEALKRYVLQHGILVAIGRMEYWTMLILLLGLTHMRRPLTRCISWKTFELH